jgi:hypothetical protein
MDLVPPRPGRTALRITESSRLSTATPMSRSTSAVAIWPTVVPSRAKGRATPATVASPTIHEKNARSRRRQQ